MTTVGKMAAGSDAQVTVLVVEDDPLQRDIYEAQFAARNLPVQLRICENGYKALIDIGAMRPDVLLLDIMMRGIDGYEVMQTVLAYPEQADVNIAILTSLGRDELEQRGCLPSGVTYFSKPVAQEELRGYIRACIAQKARRVQGR